MSSSRLCTLLSCLCLLAFLVSSVGVSFAEKDTSPEMEVAARFAPVFYQALGDKPRSDYITNFNFDGDWRGDNNWNNAGKKLALRAYIYYSVAETNTHFFIHYAVFHPRDYKGGERRGTLLSELIREGAKHAAKYDPTGIADEAALAHENDMEGALVVVKRDGNDLSKAQVEIVETLHHNKFGRYQAGDVQPGSDAIKLEAQRPVLYIEPKGHGIEAFTGDEKQISNKEFLKYTYKKVAQDPARTDSVCKNLDKTTCDKSVGYALLPLATLWSKAEDKANSTYGRTCDYGEIKLSTRPGSEETTIQTFKVGVVGCAFLGSVGGINMARPPWGWFDRDERDQPLGMWFFDPASTIKKDFNLGDEFSTTYVRLPFWTIKS